jgi:hypothetical protein
MKVILALSLAVAARADWWDDDECVDGGFEWTNKKGKIKRCNWVAKKWDAETMWSPRCSKWGAVNSGVSCSKACGTGPHDSPFWVDDETGHDCFWVSVRPSERCDRPGMDSADFGCRATCNSCHTQLCRMNRYPSKAAYENCPATAIDSSGTMATYATFDRDTTSLCADSACSQCQVIGTSQTFFDLAQLPNNIETCQFDPSGSGLYWKATTGSDDTAVTDLYYEVFKDEDCEIPDNSDLDFSCTAENIAAGAERNCVFDPKCLCVSTSLAALA